ncbi:hypothetical protein CREGCYN_13550 [Synechococcus sp. M16CYN]
MQLKEYVFAVDNCTELVSILNLKAFLCVSTATLQAAIVLGSVVLVPLASALPRAKSTPVTKDELLTYSSMSVISFCEARALDIDFVKSIKVGISAEVFTIFQKHGGRAVELNEPLDKKQFIASSQFRLVGNALRACPNFVPPEQKKKFEAMLEQLKRTMR